jgi:arginase
MRVPTHQHSLYGSAKFPVKHYGHSNGKNDTMATMTANAKPSTPITLIGVPLDLGAENLGVDIGPSAFRYQKIVQKLENTGFDVQDFGDIACKARTEAVIGTDFRLKYVDEIISVSERIANATSQAVQAGHKSVTLGGDHSITLGAFSGVAAGLQGKSVGMIYFDAHGDMNTADTTLTGNIHGMHLASLMGFGDKRLVNIQQAGATLATANLLHIAGSDWDQAELNLAEQHQLQTFSIFDLLTQGMGPLITKIDALAEQVDALYISLDLDSIDQIYAPGAGMPNPKGLAYREIAALAEYIGKHCNVVGVDVVEYNPLQDIDNKTAELGIELIARFLGKDYSWYSNYLTQNEL